MQPIANERGRAKTTSDNKTRERISRGQARGARCMTEDLVVRAVYDEHDWSLQGQRGLNSRGLLAQAVRRLRLELRENANG